MGHRYFLLAKVWSTYRRDKAKSILRASQKQKKKEAPKRRKLKPRGLDLLAAK
jgi:hypothetical protein